MQTPIQGGKTATVVPKDMDQMMQLMFDMNNGSQVYAGEEVNQVESDGDQMIAIKKSALESNGEEKLKVSRACLLKVDAPTECKKKRSLQNSRTDG